VKIFKNKLRYVFDILQLQFYSLADFRSIFQSIPIPS